MLGVAGMIAVIRASKMCKVQSCFFWKRSEAELMQ